MSDQSTTHEITPFRVIGPPPDGFTILYNEAAHLLIAEHSAVVKCYLALCLRSNNAREMFASMATIAEDMGMSVPSANRAVAQLEKIGLLKVTRPETVGRGRANEYQLLKPIMGDVYKEKNTSSGDEKSITGEIKSITGDRPTSTLPGIEQLNANKNVAREENPISVSESRQEKKQDNGVINKTLPSGAPVSLDEGYWGGLVGMQRLMQFDIVAKQYPNNGAERQSAMQAWAATIGTRLDNTQEESTLDLWHRINRGASCYATKVKGVEQKYITAFPKWIRGMLWNDAPREALERKPNVGA